MADCESSKKSTTYIIIGAVCGFVLLLVIPLTAVICCFCKTRRRFNEHVARFNKVEPGNLRVDEFKRNRDDILTIIGKSNNFTELEPTMSLTRNSTIASAKVTKE